MAESSQVTDMECTGLGLLSNALPVQVANLGPWRDVGLPDQPSSEWLYSGFREIQFEFFQWGHFVLRYNWKAWREITLFPIHHFTQHEIHSWEFHQRLLFDSGWSRGDGPLTSGQELWFPHGWRLASSKPGHRECGPFLPVMHW